MLRQALDEAASRESSNFAETDALLDPVQQEHSYTVPDNNDHPTQQQSYEDSDPSNSYNEDEAYILEEWNERNAETAELGFFGKVWNALKKCFFLVLNVENLWDSPDMVAQRPAVSRRNHLVVLFWFFILAISYSSERSTFKLLVDRTGPFRLFAVEMVTFTHAVMIGLGMLISAISRKNFQMQALGIPIVDVGLMALLDTVHILLVFLTGLHVPPTLTVILVQFTLPLTALLTQFVHPDGCGRNCGHEPGDSSIDNENNHGEVSQRDRNNADVVSEVECDRSVSREVDNVEGVQVAGCGGLCMEHILGSVIITLAVLLALCPAIYSIVDPDFFIYADAIPLQTAYNTMLFVSSCIPAAASQLYKEHIFLQYKQPVMADQLNFILSVFQLVLASIMAPLVFGLQGLGSGVDWFKLYPSKDFSKNFIEGLQCFMGILDEERASSGYAEPASCDSVLWLVLINSFSIIAVGVAVDKIVNAGATKVMYRGVSAGIILSVSCLYSYDMHIPEFNYGPAIDSLNFVCLLLLVVGSEVYHRVSLHHATFETVFPDVENFYDDLE